VPKSTSLFLASAWTTIITLLSLVNVGSIGNTIKIPHKDKMVHFVFYFLFYLLWYIYLKKDAKIKKMQKVLLVISIGYGILMEVLQALMPNHRTSDFNDMLANSFGAIVGFAVANRFITNKK
jgi:VanZ family protein